MKTAITTVTDHWSGQVIAEVNDYDFHEAPQIKINGDTFIVVHEEKHRNGNGFDISHELVLRRLIPIGS